MTAWLLFVAIVAAVVAVGMKKARERRIDRAAAQRRGATPETAMRVGNFRDMDEFVHRFRCDCGGSTVLLGEATTVRLGREFRRLRVECLRCEREHDVWFDLDATVN
jgi:hypothetical protein